MIVPNPESWNEFAKDLAKHLSDGKIITLQGPLGAGKTTFVQSLAKELGAGESPKSPTFSMMRIYAINHQNLRRLIHIDAYRIENEIDLMPLDLDEELSIPGTILLIEWPEQIPNWLATHPHTAITISIDGDGRRVEIAE